MSKMAKSAHRLPDLLLHRPSLQNYKTLSFLRQGPRRPLRSVGRWSLWSRWKVGPSCATVDVNTY